MRRRGYLRGPVVLTLLFVLFAVTLPFGSAGEPLPQRQGFSSSLAPSINQLERAVPSPRIQVDSVAPPLFCMTVQSGIFSGMPWPSVPIAGIRLWDTYTNWSVLEPSRGKFDWPALDRWLDIAREHGVDVLYTFGGTPTWASANPGGKCDYNPGGCYPPARMEDWDEFVRAIATHAAGRIKYWELWNEANQHEYWSGGIPALVTMAQHTRAIVKAADPNAEIFTPSGVGGATETAGFLDQFLAGGGGAYVDGVAFHGYVNSNPSSPEETARIVDAVQGVMARQGMAGRELWDTEGSWGPANHLPDEGDQVAFLVRAYVLQWSKGVRRFYWYAWNDENYGTLWDRQTRSVRRAGQAYGTLAGWLAGATATAPCTVAADATWTCDLVLADGSGAQIVWTSATAPRSSRSFYANSKYHGARGLDGTVTPIANGGVQIGPSPVFLTQSVR